MKVPLQDLKRQAERHGRAWAEACGGVVNSGWYVLGPHVQAFEKEFAAYLGAPFCATVANGTDALELALRALGVGPGDDVLQAANAGMYGTVATLATGARPVYADITFPRLSPDVETLAAARTPQTKAVIVTHLHGWACAIEDISRWCQAEGLALIEDCAESHGARVGDRLTGCWGDIGCFSFYPTKNLGALGDGGACVTARADLDGRLRHLRQYGWTSRYHAQLAGGRNSRLDEMQAAVLRLKLPLLDSWNTRRQAIAQRYREAFVQLGLGCPENAAGDYVGHLFVLRTANRSRLRDALTSAGIATDIHFPTPDYRQPAVVARLGVAQNLPRTEEACASILTLPCFPEMEEDEIEAVIAAVRQAASAG